MKKTILIASIILALGFAVAGCGQPATQPAREKEAEKFPATPAVVDTKQAIKRLLADKYDKNIDEVTIDIEVETQEHVRGYATFAPGGPENIGLFLAAKVDQTWQIIFDGNGSVSCQELDKYEFPGDMKKGCHDDQSSATQTQTTQESKEVSSGEEFNITLKSNVTSGYKWEVVYGQEYLELTDQAYIAPEDQNVIGVAGQEKFEFKALKIGNTQVIFSYSRPWEQDVEPIKKAVYNISIN